jgi:hypothetical protein
MQATCTLSHATPIQTLTPVQAGILKTLLYFDIFNYPLTGAEIFENCQERHATKLCVLAELSVLVSGGMVRQTDEFYHLSADGSIVERRRKGNHKAEKHLSTAHRFTRLISRFPFVEAVFISGSLAKGYMDEKSDIDYFIITSPQRLWVCRTLLITFKKIFLLNSRKYFCVNYFIDSAHLELPDKNIFTATELVFAIPMYNPVVCARFIQSNNWRQTFYPNKPFPVLPPPPSLLSPVKQLLEWVLGGAWGERLDNWCFRTTLRYWKKKFVHFDESEFDLNFRSRKHTSKHHPGGFQFRVLKAHADKISAFSEKHGIKFAS